MVCQCQFFNRNPIWNRTLLGRNQNTPETFPVWKTLALPRKNILSQRFSRPSRHREHVPQGWGLIATRCPSSRTVTLGPREAMTPDASCQGSRVLEFWIPQSVHLESSACPNHRFLLPFLTVPDRPGGQELLQFSGLLRECYIAARVPKVELLIYRQSIVGSHNTISGTYAMINRAPINGMNQAGQPDRLL